MNFLRNIFSSKKMKIGFDKVYCISYCRNIEKQKNMRKVMKYLGIDFEFIYGADYSNMEIFKHKDFYFEGGASDDIDRNERFDYYTHFIGASYDHYTAIINAYESGANSVLIMEDDCKFYNDKQYINYYLNNYPKDADMIKYGCFSLFHIKENENINEHNKYYLCNRDLTIDFMGCQMYGICNRETMKGYIDLQKNHFAGCDAMHLRLYDVKKDFKCYGLFYPLAVDGHMIGMCDDSLKNKYKLLEKIN